jgi:uncharacterized protein
MTAAFAIPWADLDWGPKRVDSVISTEWLREALSQTEAEPRGAGRLAVELTKNGEQVMVRGTVEAPLTMPCSRTLDPVAVDVRASLFLMLSPAPISPEQTGRAGRRRRGHERGPEGAKPEREKVKAKGHRRGLESELSDSEAATDVYFAEQIVLDPFVREFILLELPMVPLREDLRSDEDPASPPPSADRAEPERPIDPRLAPLAEIASRLRRDKE